MNSKTQATKGFKTFILTLGVSLIVFSAIYYVINTEQEETSYVEKNEANRALSAPITSDNSTEATTLGEADVRAEEESAVVTEDTEEKVSVFEELANQKMDNVPQRHVLAGSGTADTATTAVVATESTTDTTEVAQSTVPDTGISGPTLGIVLTLVILGFAAYVMFIGPRNIALYNFEKDVLDDLD